MTPQQALEAKIKEVKLTKPQLYIANRLIKGDRLLTVNEDYMNGGNFVWINGDDNIRSIDHAGKVYKSFFNLMRITNLNPSDYQSKLKGVKWR